MTKKINTNFPSIVLGITLQIFYWLCKKVRIANSFALKVLSSCAKEYGCECTNTYVAKLQKNVWSTVLSKDLKCKQIPPPQNYRLLGLFKTFLKFMMIDSKPNLIQYFKIWHRVVDSSQLVMGLMKTRRNLNFEVRRERNFIQILRYLMHLTNLS